MMKATEMRGNSAEEMSYFMIMDTKFLGYKTKLISKCFNPVVQAQEMFSHLEQKYEGLQIEWKQAIGKFRGEVESLEKYITEDHKQQAQDDLLRHMPPVSVIDDLTLMATKGIVTKGVMMYISSECYN